MTDGAGRHFRLVLTTQAQRAEEPGSRPFPAGRNRPLFLIPCRVTPNMAGQRHPSVCRVADARPGIPGEFTCRAAGALWLDAARRTGGSV
ncbi:hypothetical protein GS581_07905 [Escherichia coli]|nr:hypothetical protein [Escherichia coli]